jgi:hypothetical protein
MNDKPVANPLIVLHEEFDDWAILLDPDRGNAFGLNPTGIFVWKLLGESPLDFYKMYAFYFRIRERAQDWIEYLFRMIITGLLIEWRPLRLPRSFRPLYFMLRPFRLARKHGMTLMRQVS